jgi:acyl-coenzyme A thioesterase PaaI-like protein
LTSQGTHHGEAALIDSKFEELLKKAIDMVPGIRRTNLKVLDMHDRYAKVMMPLEGNGNHIGIMYAGSLFTLGEFAGGVIHLASLDVNRFFPIVKEVSIRFRRPAMTDVTMEVSLTPDDVARIEQDVPADGKADFHLELELKDASGEIVSLVSGTWQIRIIPDGMSIYQ